MRNSMDRAARCLGAWLNPNQHSLPTSGYEPAHDTGRWWDAMLRYESATGVRITEATETAMMANIRSLTDNPAALLASDLTNPHNLRESMLAYTVLYRFRRSDWAASQGRKLVRTIAGLIDPDGQMDYAGLAKLVGKPLTDDELMMHRSPAGQWFSGAGSTGRAIEPLVLFHEATGDDAALTLATRLAEVHLRNIIDPSGAVRKELLDPSHVGHTHSYCGTLRGMLLLGLHTKDKQFIDAVASTYRKGLWGTSVSYSGWTPHDQGKVRFPDDKGDPVGETASCGDVAQIALWLALRAGQTDLLDDVDRLIRARVLPSQTSDPSNPKRDGGWGSFGNPYGKDDAYVLPDVIAAVLHTLCDVHGSVVTDDGKVLSVNLHLGIDAPSATVRVERGPDAALHVTPKQSRRMRIRVPGWAPRESVRLSRADRDLPLRWDGRYLVVETKVADVGVPVTLHHSLPETQVVETMPVSRRKFTLTWRGDEVAICDPPVALYGRP